MPVVEVRRVRRPDAPRGGRARRDVVPDGRADGARAPRPARLPPLPGLRGPASAHVRPPGRDRRGVSPAGPEAPRVRPPRVGPRPPVSRPVLRHPAVDSRRRLRAARPGARRAAQMPVVGVVGPFEAPLKGIAVALGAVARLRAQGRDVRLYRASALRRPPPSGGCSSRTSSARRSPRRSCRSGTTRATSSSSRRSTRRASAFRRSRRWRRASPPSSRTSPRSPCCPPTPSRACPPATRRPWRGRPRASWTTRHFWSARRARGLETARTFTADRVLDRLEAIFGQKIS